MAISKCAELRSEWSFSIKSQRQEALPCKDITDRQNKPLSLTFPKSSIDSITEVSDLEVAS